MARKVSKEYILSKVNEVLNTRVFVKEMNEFWVSFVCDGAIVTAFTWGVVMVSFEDHAIECHVGGDELYKRLAKEVKHE